MSNKNWTVESASGSKYHLKYKGKTVDIQNESNGKRTLEAQAVFANERNLIPDRSSCACDPGPRKTTANKLRECPELFK